jgi:hypothetical protein
LELVLAISRLHRHAGLWIIRGALWSLNAYMAVGIVPTVHYRQIITGTPPSGGTNGKHRPCGGITVSPWLYPSSDVMK